MSIIQLLINILELYFVNFLLKKYLFLTYIIQKLAYSSWGASAETLRTSAVALFYSMAEYCAPIWLNSKHRYHVDTSLNQTIRLITGTPKTTPMPWLPVLSIIAQVKIRRLSALYKLFRKCTLLPMLPIQLNADPYHT